MHHVSTQEANRTPIERKITLGSDSSKTFEELCKSSEDTGGTSLALTFFLFKV